MGERGGGGESGAMGDRLIRSAVEEWDAGKKAAEAKHRLIREWAVR